MDAQEFARYHLPALETDEVRYNMQIAVLLAALAGSTSLEYWTLGGPGHCATRSPGHGIPLGALDRWPSKRELSTTPVSSAATRRRLGLSRALRRSGSRSPREFRSVSMSFGYAPAIRAQTGQREWWPQTTRRCYSSG
jgi:hypothetical protein